jgi:threonyl-tRNA synthetase
MAVKVKYKGKEQAFTEAPNSFDALKAMGVSERNKAALVKVNGELYDLYRKLPEGEIELDVVLPDSADGLSVLRHSCAHVMATAIRHLYPNAKFAHGPATDDGFFYDFDIGQTLTPDELPKIEAEMMKIIKEDHRFVRSEKTKAESREWAKQEGGPYKVPFVEKEQSDRVSFYQDADFLDLCIGPHVPSTGWIKAAKLLKITGAYFLGDEHQPMLTRLYGTAFPSKEGLEHYLKQLEEAEKRDHRRLGKDLDLFSIHHNEVGGGLIHWHPKGSMVRYLIEQYWYDLHLKNGYQLTYTPHIVSEELYKISGHLQTYSDNMYSSMDIEGKPYRIKPMNCPGHIMIYRTKVRSYRDLPLRYAEMGTVYRFERSGVMHGLMRVRGFTIDDAHIFVAPDQVEDEILRVYQLAMEFLGKFGFPDLEIKLSTRPAKSIGTQEQWDMATNALKNVMTKVGKPYEIEEGGGAFYGPKISIYIKDSLGRLWQCSTVQFDFNLPSPERFDLHFVGEDNRPHQPYMVHRALMGSVERFFGVLIEHYAGEFPLWLAPVQVAVIPVTEEHLAYAKETGEKLTKLGYRVEVDSSNERIGYKIRAWTLQKVPYMLVVGAKEAQSGQVAVRERKKGDLGPMAFDKFVEILKG